jgi:hypothetical protein
MRLIVTNGDAAIARLREGGIKDDILAWRDVLHEGPVPAEERLERLSQIRAAFIARNFGIPHDEVALSFAERDSDIRTHSDYERVEIWVEHDLYDQLQLLQILNFFAEEGRSEGIYLVQASDYLGTLDGDAVGTLETQAAEVTAPQFALACSAWHAFTSPDPSHLVEIAQEDTGALPFLKPALRTASQLFRDVGAQEEARFMGDASFFGRINDLAFVNEPLVQGVEKPFRIDPENGGTPSQALIRLTSAGREVLSGRLDHAMVNDVDRWIGGTRLRPALLLRYDRKQGQLIANP